MTLGNVEDIHIRHDFQRALNEMVKEVLNGPPIYQSSQFWEQIGTINRMMLEELGIGNFKRSVAQNYFNWLIMNKQDPQYRSVRKLWIQRPSLQPYFNIMKKLPLIKTIQPYLNRLNNSTLLRQAMGPEQHVGRAELKVYKLFVGMLYEYARQQDWSGIGKRITEPALGNPIPLFRRGKLISQDLANSIREYNAILSHSKIFASSPKKVAELGAGYGRVAYVFLSDQQTKYFIFDIPPALLIAQWYLCSVFPNKKAFTFRHINIFSDIIDELNHCDFAFFTPNQIELFPDEFFDFFISISTLPEMTMAQMNNYLQQSERTSSKYIYLKQWLNWENTLDGNRVNSDTIKLGENWNLVIDRNDAVQPAFFERLWCRK